MKRCFLLFFCCFTEWFSICLFAFMTNFDIRNTGSCLAQGQAIGTAAALCAAQKLDNVRDLKYSDLRATLERDNVWFEPKPVAYKN